MSKLQDLLDQEAQLANTGLGNSEARMQLHTAIRLMRGADTGGESPWCFGQDDCSTNILSMCPWRIDCGA